MPADQMSSAVEARSAIRKGETAAEHARRGHTDCLIWALEQDLGRSEPSSTCAIRSNARSACCESDLSEYEAAARPARCRNRD